MLTLTRADALTHARFVFSRLASRAHEAAGDDSEYVEMLARSWDERLAELAHAAAPSAITEDVWRALESLTATISGELTSDALIEWVDAFPDAVVSLLPSAAEISFEDLDVEPAHDADWPEVTLEDDAHDRLDAEVELEPVTAGNRQSTLALAA
jgi:hypothetical protein